MELFLRIHHGKVYQSHRREPKKERRNMELVKKVYSLTSNFLICSVDARFLVE
jgi:hypothetical protein